MLRTCVYTVHTACAIHSNLYSFRVGKLPSKVCRRGADKSCEETHADRLHMACDPVWLLVGSISCKDNADAAQPLNLFVAGPCTSALILPQTAISCRQAKQPDCCWGTSVQRSQSAGKQCGPTHTCVMALLILCLFPACSLLSPRAS